MKTGGIVMAYYGAYLGGYGPSGAAAPGFEETTKHSEQKMQARPS